MFFWKSLQERFRFSKSWATDSPFTKDLQKYNIYYMFYKSTWEIYCQECRAEWVVPVGSLRFGLYMVRQHFIPSHEEAIPSVPVDGAA